MKIRFSSNDIKFNRGELSGAFGDIGSDLPLIMGLILVCGLNAFSVLAVFGVMLIISGIYYGLPMPLQPLKALAAIGIATKADPGLIYGAGIAIGIVMLFFTLSGILDRIVRMVPEAVVRGIQFGLGMKLILLAGVSYVPSGGTAGYVLAASGLIITIFIFDRLNFTPALFLLLLGILYAVIFSGFDISMLKYEGIELPVSGLPASADILTGFLVLGLPQIPLSISNSIVATKKIADDYFPEKKICVKKIGMSYSVLNIISPFVGGIPVCHGSGGVAGHFAFGARTGGSIIIYGLFFIMLALVLGGNPEVLKLIFPVSILGVILLVEGYTLIQFIKLVNIKDQFYLAVITGFISVFVKYGFAVAIVSGTVLYYLLPYFPRMVKHATN